MNSPGPLKILFCIDALVRGGTELQLTGLIDRLDRTRFQPHLLTIRPSPPELTPRNCPHLAWNVPRLVSPGGIRAAWRLGRWLRHEDFQIVQTFFQDSTLLGGVAARFAGVPTRLACFRDLGFWRTRSQALLLHRVYPLMTGYLCNSRVVQDNFVEHDGLPPDAFQVIHNGIDVQAMPWVDHQGPTRHVGIVGNLTRQVKRTDLFIRAAGLVAGQPGAADVTWHIIGDGQLRGEYEALADKVGIARNTVFTGRIDDVPGYLEKLQVGVMCSDSEGFSNGILEYQLKGCACVATAVGGNTEAVQHEKTGLLVPPDDPEALAEALHRMIADVPLRRRLATQARAVAEADFNWEKCVAEHEAYYLASHARHARP